MADKEVVEIRTRSSFGTLLSGFIIGGLIGATVALLSAPQSGAETRAMLRERSSELRDRAADVASDTAARANQMISDARDKASEAISTTKNKTDQVLNKGQDMMQQ